MPWRGPEYPGEFPTLGYLVAEVIQSVCAIPDGPRAGDPYILTDEQLRFLLFHYRIDPDTRRDPTSGLWRNAFVYNRGSQLTRPQKWGKGPFGSAIICGEAHPEGPVLFDGWDSNGDPVGRPWPTPHIQVTAVSEDQVANVFRALLPMIELGDMAADIPDTGQTRINLPSGGLIEPVTSSALSRLGQRVTFVLQDQTESWRQQNGGRALADNQRRGLAGMGGRWIETPNAWDPAEDSVAQQTYENDAKAGGVYIDDVDVGKGSVRNKADRRRMLRKAYGDSVAGRKSEHTGAAGWVDIDRIDSEIVALLDRDPAQAERWFLNRKQAGEAVAFDRHKFAELATADEVADGELITLGIDGARFVDALAIIATGVVSGHQWPIGIWERPESAPDDYEHPFDEVDGAMIEAFDRWEVWRAYADPQYIEDWVDKWQGRWGPKRVIKWYTNRPRPIAWAVRRYGEAIACDDLSHDGDTTFITHVGNAHKQKLQVRDEHHRQMHTIAKDRQDSPRKIDAAMAGVVSWEARGDAIADGALEKRAVSSNLWGPPADDGGTATATRQPPGRRPKSNLF